MEIPHINLPLVFELPIVSIPIPLDFQFKEPPLPSNSKKLSVVRYGYSLESPNDK